MPELIIIMVTILIAFGAGKLPKSAQGWEKP
jgi:Sec-independent protein translocase protein TatA